ncbi:hypothetical protein [Tabrizicola caldifontis]|uniref:hypothetical protein n=1 Tax=Tabrizicola caldifontis TaxID=2528036 RepID=UPI0010818C04|nr:hypothetical protein [Rhodobacter sp. YIM 73028]
MSFIRPELRLALGRWREVIAAGAVVLLGGWIAAQGGFFLLPIGGAILLFGLGWALYAFRRLRFRQWGEAPGIVRVTEAQIAYMGPRVGGFVGLPDLAELRLLTLRGRRVWRLRQGDGQTLFIPVEAEGAEALFDAFAALPGMDTAALVAALGTTAASDGRNLALDGADRLIWARRGSGVVVHEAGRGSYPS